MEITILNVTVAGQERAANTKPSQPPEIQQGAVRKLNEIVGWATLPNIGTLDQLSLKRMVAICLSLAYHRVIHGLEENHSSSAMGMS